MRKIVCILLAAFFMIGCGGNDREENIEDKNLHDAYPQVGETNRFYYGNEESLKNLLEHGTGIIFLGDAESEYCQAYAPLLAAAMDDAGTKAMYVEWTSLKSSAKKEITDYIAAQEAEITSAGEVGVPLVIFVQKGTIAAYNNETADMEEPVSTYWTAEKSAAFHDRMFDAAMDVRAAQNANDSQGCSFTCEEE